MDDDDLLYHYTTAEGLLGIAGTPWREGAFWLSQIQYMNDREEWYHAFRLARDEIARPERKSSGLREALKGLYGLSHDDPPSFSGRDIRLEVGFERCFVLSVTEDGDLLSQWRGYAANGGYSVGFRVGDLKGLAASNRFDLQPCIYDETLKLEVLRNGIDEIESQLTAGDIDHTIRFESCSSDSEKSLATARVRFQRLFNQLARYLKHDSFAEEREWRITGAVGAIGDRRANWRTRGSMIIPYCQVDIGNSASYPVPIRKVIVGPTVDFHLAEHAITFVQFAKMGSFEIQPSKSTLRT